MVKSQLRLLARCVKNMNDKKEFKLPTGIPGVIGFKDFSDKLRDQSVKGILFLRHAERPPLEKDDPTFGAALGITDNGVKMTQSCGKILGSIEGCVFGATPMRRTHETARVLADSMGYSGANIFDAPEAGVAGIYAENFAEIHKGYEREGAIPFTDKYLNTGTASGYVPLKEGTRRICKWLTETDFGGRCTVIVSHDIFIAAILRSLDVGIFDSENWIGFLQAAAFINDKSNMWKVYYCVPDMLNYQTKFYS